MNRANPLVDRTSAICTFLASSVNFESFVLAISISFYSIDFLQAQLHLLLWKFLQFLLVCWQNNAEILLSFDILACSVMYTKRGVLN